MFPSNLHKNIIQLDRQISLLENECKNMEIDKRKKGSKSELSHGRCTKVSSLQLKASPVKVTLRNTDCFKRNKKLVSPVSGKLQPVSPLQSHCSQSWSETCEAVAGRKPKLNRINTVIPECSSEKLNGVHWDSGKKNKCLNCTCKAGSTLDLHKVDSVEDPRQEQVLHKELLYSNSGATIEVTVTQKSGSGKQISPIKKTIDLEDKKYGQSCKCQIKGQKWSEILCSDTSKKKAINKENFVKNKITGDENRATNQPLISLNSNGRESNKTQESINNSNNINNLSVKDESIEMPVKLSSPSHKYKNLPQCNSNKLEKEIQCALENINDKEPVKEAKDPIKIIQHLVNELKQMPKQQHYMVEKQHFNGEKMRDDPKKKEPYSCVNEFKQISKDMETISSKSCKESVKELSKEIFLCGDNGQNKISLELMKKQCENLIKDKELLSKELAAKDIVIITMNKREEEYLSLINNLKLNLEKTRENAQENAEAIKEMHVLKNKLLEKMKFSETIQKNFSKAHELLEKYIMENQKLKTQIKILILEAQKHEVLLAGKEAEINKYKEEIQNFQQQISEHLAILRSNAQGIDIEKMVQAIFQQSQIFLQTDLDSVVVENGQKDSSKQQNVLMHSSPTSSKSSVVNSSWKQISSIHDRDQSKANSDFNLNDDVHAKDYFQIFGDNSSSISKSAKKGKQTLIESLLDGNNIKGSLSFTSCISVQDDQNSSSGRSSSSSSSSSNGDCLTSNNETLSNGEKAVVELEKSNQVSFEKAQSNIDEVLKNMKLKFSKKIFETSFTNCTIDDFLGSQISSASQ